MGSDEHDQRVPHHWRGRTWGIINSALILLISGFLIISKPPEHTVELEYIGETVSPSTKIVIEFDRPIGRDAIAVMEPALAGNWSYEEFALSSHLARRLVFIPEVSLEPDTEYRVAVTGIHNIFTPHELVADVHLAFRTPSVSTVVDVEPATTPTLNPDISWKVHLDQTNPGLALFEFAFDPAVEYDVQLSPDGKQYELKPKQLLLQGTTYTLTILRRTVQYFIGTEDIAYQSDPQTVYSGTWTTREAPGITEFTPTGDAVKWSERIAVTFTEPMDGASVIAATTVEPAGTGTWEASEDQKTFTYSTDSLEKDTAYAVKIAAGAKTATGGYLETEAAYAFSTLGPVRVARFSPSSGSTGAAAASTIRVTFDQSVEHPSAEVRFHLEPNVAGGFAWEGNTMIFSPASPLAFNSSYSVTVDSGVKSIDGMNSQDAFSSTFSTELSQVKLAVPFHRQERPLSCEAATLVMALRYKGVNVSESTLIDKIGFDPTPHVGNVWGNPHIAFVGDYYGRQATTGYGVYWQPISRVASEYRTSRWFTNGTIQDVTTEIQKGNPVIVWGNAASGKRVDWKTKDGGSVIAIVGEHTRVAIGYVGSADNPTSIIVLDPLSGEKYYSTSAFMSNWSTLGRAGVVVE
ncbi:MAG: Ig-like domain-containing protein [Patescibacteria group bacterium]|jgi:uncharacterized protein YvpB